MDSREQLSRKHIYALIIPGDSCICIDRQYDRLSLYLKAVRVVNIAGCLPALHRIHGFQHLLEIFPLANRVTALGHRLTTSNRTLQTVISTADLEISTKLTSENIHRFSGTALSLKIFGVDCTIGHDSLLDVHCPLDWDLAHWEHIRWGSGTAIATYQRVGGRRQLGKVPLGLVIGRDVRSLCFDTAIDPSALSEHLARRRRLGFANIHTMTVGPTLASGVPPFLREQSALRNITLLQGVGDYFDIVDFFMYLDWSCVRDLPPGSKLLKRCTLFVNCRSARPFDATAARRGAGLRRPESVFDLQHLTLRLESRTFAHPSKYRLPALSLLARSIVDFAGRRCRCEVKLDEGWRETAAMFAVQLEREIEYIQADLLKEQQEERGTQV